MQPTKIKIVGILKEGAKIPIGDPLISESIDYNALYYPYSFEMEQMPLILLSASALDQTAGENIKQGVSSLSMIIYSDDTAEETIHQRNDQTFLYSLHIKLWFNL